MTQTQRRKSPFPDLLSKWWLILIDSLDGYPFVCLLNCQILSKAEEVPLKKAQNNGVQKIDNYVTSKQIYWWYDWMFCVTTSNARVFCLVKQET